MIKRRLYSLWRRGDLSGGRAAAKALCHGGGSGGRRNRRSFDSASVGTGHPADQAASRPSLFKRRRADRDQKKYGGSCAGIFSVGIWVFSGRRTDVWFSHGVSCLCLGQRSTVRRKRAGISGSRRRTGSSSGKEEMESRFARVRTRQRLRRKRLWQILCTNTKTRSI